MNLDLLLKWPYLWVDGLISEVVSKRGSTVHVCVHMKVGTSGWTIAILLQIFFIALLYYERFGYSDLHSNAN